MVAKRDLYEVLGVSKDASDADIKRAYRKLSKQYHPDINKEAGAEEKFKEIAEAYEILSDSQKRAAYDQYGHASYDPNSGFSGGGFGGFGGFGGQGFSGSYTGGFEDIFDSFFGGGGARRGNRANMPRQGADLQYVMDLTFEEAIFGKEEVIHYHRNAECETCHGSGAKPGTDPVTCSKCHGAGVINVERTTPFGRMMSQTTCDVCGGTGQEIKEKCETCHGHKHVEETHKVKVKVPAGVENGNQMPLRGQGEAGVNGGPYGDLYVIFRVGKSDTFEREGADIFYELPINFAQAALGDEVDVPTVHGKVKLKVPAGTQSGTVLRLRGKGAPRLRGSGMGDQHVTVRVVTPKHLTDKQREAMQIFGKEAGTHVEGEGNFFDKMKDAFKDSFK